MGIRRRRSRHRSCLRSRVVVVLALTGNRVMTSSEGVGAENGNDGAVEEVEGDPWMVISTL